MDTLTFFIDNPQSYLIVVGILSLFIGSFLNVVIVRLPRIMEHNWSEECRLFLRLCTEPAPAPLNLCLPASHCPACQAPIRPWHNIPLASYLWLRGQCNHCHSRISWRYPLVEAFTAMMSVYVAWRFGVTLTALFALLFTWIIIPLTFIDIDRHLLPDQLTLSLLWLGLIASLFHLFCTPNEAIVGAIVGYLLFAGIQWVFHLATGKIGMGQGDYKFLAAIGATLGWQLLPLVVLLASVTGIGFTLIHMAVKRNFHSHPLPFGPYLALGGWIALLWGPDLMHYYLISMN